MDALHTSFVMSDWERERESVSLSLCFSGRINCNTCDVKHSPCTRIYALFVNVFSLSMCRSCGCHHHSFGHLMYCCMQHLRSGGTFIYAANRILETSLPCLLCWCLCDLQWEESQGGLWQMLFSSLLFSSPLVRSLMAIGQRREQRVASFSSNECKWERGRGSERQIVSPTHPRDWCDPSRIKWVYGEMDHS